MFLNTILHPVPYRLNWIQIWAIRRRFHHLNSSPFKYLHCELRRVPFGIILLELKLGISLVDPLFIPSEPTVVGYFVRQKVS
jgi:hypothetical protein